MGVFPSLPPDYQSWTFPGGAAAARGDVAAPVRAALESAGSLYRWAAAQPEREVFLGRGEAYGVRLAQTAAVVRHARRGGAVAPLLGDWYAGTPRVVRELEMSGRLAEREIPTPAVLAGVVYRAGLGHRADVATQRIEGVDLATAFFGERPMEPADRHAVLHRLGVLVRRLHAAGFVHPDLQLRNVLAGRPAGAPLRLYLLDVDTCRQVGPLAHAAHRRNLDRFARSWAKWNRAHGSRLVREDWERFDSAYRGEDS